MGGTYQRDVGLLRFASPSTLAVLGGAVLSLCGVLLLCACSTLAAILPLKVLPVLGWVALALGVVACAAGIVAHVVSSDAAQIAAQVRRGLCDPRIGNPLHLKEGERLPRVKCVDLGHGRYSVTVACAASTVEDIAAASSAISTALNRRYERYAVVNIDPDVAFNHVTFTIEDVAVDKSLTITDVEALRPTSPTKLVVDKVTSIDLTTSGHVLTVAKTRSGKTTGVISLLLQVLMAGPDAYGSQVLIIDPKKAELSRLPHTVSLDEDGEARGLLAAIKSYAGSITERQVVLNDLSEKTGDAVKWWDAGMKSSWLFLDEYVALRAILPAKASKEDPDYCLATLDAILKKCVTMGASAGCYTCISIAEASVQEGGLPSMLRSAMSTRILFRPTIAEARLLWPSEKLEAMSTGRVYGPGDAWFSSTDGEHDNVSYVHFPRMEFPVYRELGRLLEAYYGDTQESTPTAPADAEQ